MSETGPVPFRKNRLLQACTIWIIVLWTITAINPLYPRDWLLENLLVFISCAVLMITISRFQFSNLSYGLFTLFLSLHLVGAHYTYAETPIGFWFQDWFGWERNHYDRLVHFAFGLLIAYPIRELLLRCSHTGDAWASASAVSHIVMLSAVHEIIEAIVAIIVDPELGAAYLGIQGDEWDAQKDTGLALFGAIIAIAVSETISSCRRKNER